jgi:hypothetical protein
MLLGAGIDPQTLCLTVLRCTIELHGLLSNIHPRILGIGTYSCRSSIQLYSSSFRNPHGRTKFELVLQVHTKFKFSTRV